MRLAPTLIELERRSLDTLLIVAGSAAGSAQVTDGERINFFKRAEAAKAGLSFVGGETHREPNNREADHVHSEHGDSFGEHCVRDGIIQAKNLIL